MIGDRRLNELFHRAVTLGRDRRDAFLEEACRGNQELRRELESLLAAHDNAGRFLQAPAWTSVSLAESSERLAGRRVGPYKLVREIGRGGMGTVYLAERSGADFRQRVAIKLLRSGFNSSHILGRFKQERRILATLEHPFIAKLLDGGATDDGQPYLVMEYIEGKPIHRYCDQLRLDIEARIQLFRKVCAAVHAAHQSLVIHRDLKPGNILVTADGTPKLLDFGTAKLLDPAAYGTALPPTATGLHPLTPQYASPEQVRGDHATTATDVYSLGVVLYELLTGHPPYQISSRRPAELLRAVCEEEPGMPSAVVHRPLKAAGDQVTTARDLSARRQSHPDRLSRRLVGDLDTIVLMALRKEPRRRYASVEQLADDLRRHGESLPVRARRDTVGYRAGRFLRRNRVFATAATSAATALGTGAFAALRQARVARRERDRATAAAEEAQSQKALAEQVSTFLIDLFRMADPSGETGRELSARELLELGVKRAAKELESRPDLQASLLEALGRMTVELGFFDKGVEYLEQALRVRSKAEEPNLALATTHDWLAEANLGRCDFPRVELHAREAVRIKREASGPGDPTLPNSLGWLALALEQEGEQDEALEVMNEALRLSRQDSIDRDLNFATLESQGCRHAVHGRFRQAELFFHQSLMAALVEKGAAHPDVLRVRNNLANTQRLRGRYTPARTALEINIKSYQNSLSPDHPFSGLAMQHLGCLYLDVGRPEDAESIFARSLEIMERSLGGGHRWTLLAAAHLAAAMQSLERYDEAEPLFSRSWKGLRNSPSSGRVSRLWVQTLYGRFLLRRAKSSSGEALLRDAIAEWASSWPHGHPTAVHGLVSLAELALERDRLATARSMIQRGLAVLRRELLPSHWRIAELETLLARCLLKEDRRDEAIELLERSLPLLERHRDDRYRRLRIAQECWRQLHAGSE